MNLEILYHDNHFVAINKPSGLLVHRSPIDRHETRFAMQMTRDMIGQHVYPIHRLDKPTSGVLLFGLSPEAAHKAQTLIQTGEMSKTYMAVVRGFTPNSLDINHRVKAVDDNYDDSNDTDKPARTLLKTLLRCELPIPMDKYPASRYSLVELKPLTGRRHQLRYHMKHISHPIIGDAKYGKGNHNRLFQQTFDSHRLLLAATDLTFKHPFTEADIHIHAPLHEDFSWVHEMLPWQKDCDSIRVVQHAS